MKLCSSALQRAGAGFALVRGRGLKRSNVTGKVATPTFALVRGRGLKLRATRTAASASHVRPRAGAWIETTQKVNQLLNGLVRPRAGAWIETRRRSDSGNVGPVRPRAGAWIETMMRIIFSGGFMFALVRGRGLKRFQGKGDTEAAMFALVRGRGLKQGENLVPCRGGWFALVRGRGLKHRATRLS